MTFNKGTLTEIHDHIPEFKRRCFALTQPGNERARLNEPLDTIFRVPFSDDKAFIPVGIISKNYTIVPYTAVLDVATKALEDAKITPADVKAELEISEYGERMALSLFLPCKYCFDPGGSHPMSLRLE